MYLATFEYCEPESLEEVCSLLDHYDGKAKLIAGGTDLVVQMKLKTLRPRCLINLKRIPGLGEIRYDESEGLTIGALVTHRALSTSAIVREKYKVLASASSKVGSVQVQNVGTIGGNICNASPAADTAPALLALGASLTAVSVQGERVIKLDGFFRGPGETVLRNGEIVSQIMVPPMASHMGAVYHKLGLRKAMDLAIVGVAIAIRLNAGSKTCKDARIVLGAVAPTPMRAEGAEEILRGKKIDNELIEQAAQKTASACRPITDVQATAEYRKEMVEVLTRRAVEEAVKIAELF